MQPERLLDDRASRRFGLVLRDDALAAGVSPTVIRDRLRTGQWVAVHPGVYRVAAAPQTWEQRLAAACLAAGPEAAVGLRSAAVYWSLLKGTPVEIVVPYRRSPELDGVLVHRSRDLDDAWVVRRDGLRVTNPLLTLLDLGAVAPEWLVARAFDVAHGRKLFTLAAAQATLATFGRKGRRGVGPFRRVVEARGGDPAGVFEAVVATFLREHDLPAFVPEHELWVGDRFVARFDFARPEVRFGLDLNGYEPHSTPAQFERDHTRRRGIQAAGWTHLEFTWADVRDRPEATANAILRTYLGLL